MRPGRRRRVLVGGLVASAAVALAFGYLATRPRPLPGRTLLIGYQHNPPYQVHRPGIRPTGLSVETVAEAAHRSRIGLEWREAPEGPDEALSAGTVDLWPLITDLPERRRRLHISAPWLQAQHAIVVPEAAATPGEDFEGRIAITAIPIHARMVRERYPGAHPVESPEGRDALRTLCTGAAEATFLESRLAYAVLAEKLPECEGIELRAELVPGGYQLGVGATFEAAGAADRIRDEIGRMAKDGTLAVLMARHSFFGLNDTRATYDLIEAQARNRGLLWVIGGLSVALALTLWLAWSLRGARRATERARSELERAVVELEHRAGELERFNYTVSHDLRSPLVTVTGFLGAIESAALAGRTDQVLSDVTRIRAAARRMDQLLTELLELSSVGRVSREPVTVPFAEVVQEAWSLVDGRLRARGVAVEVAEGLPAVHGDRQRLVQLLQNLLDNAAKFMGDEREPRIEVGARRDAGAPVFFVRDNGRGIDPRYHEKVFGLFDRLDTAEDGTGVGLALVKRIVELYGGRVWVESQGAGRGSTFCFTLPGAEPPQNPSQVGGGWTRIPAALDAEAGSPGAAARS
jgi:signal transduction histidine kinase